MVDGVLWGGDRRNPWSALAASLARSSNQLIGATLADTLDDSVPGEGAYCLGETGESLVLWWKDGLGGNERAMGIDGDGAGSSRWEDSWWRTECSW